MASFFTQLLIFINRVMHHVSVMFVAGMATLSYIADNNLYGHDGLRKWANFFGLIVLITGFGSLYSMRVRFTVPNPPALP